MDFLSFPIDLYCKTPPRNVETLDLVRGEDDFRKVFIVDTDTGKFVVKHTSNSFTSRDRIEGWQKLAAAYRSLGIYCPSPLPDLLSEKYRLHTKSLYIQRRRAGRLPRFIPIHEHILVASYR